eukprot:363953-Chlamydomonas_euryale.AAC.11
MTCAGVRAKDHLPTPAVTLTVNMQSMRSLDLKSKDISSGAHWTMWHQRLLRGDMKAIVTRQIGGKSCLECLHACSITLNDTLGKYTRMDKIMRQRKPEALYNTRIRLVT